MNIEERIEFVREKVEKVLIPILQKKGKDQTCLSDNNDTNVNFKIISDFIGNKNIDKYQILLVYFVKHLLSIMTWIRTRELESEGLDSRIADAINYLLILWSMIEEDDLNKTLVDADTNESRKGIEESEIQYKGVRFILRPVR